MEQIKNYIEALFSSLPKTDEVLRMQINMLSNMEEKYHALLGEGKGQAEAVGLIIAQIGSVDDLKQELGLLDQAPQGALQAEAAAEAAIGSPALSDNPLRQQYFEFKRKMGLFIAIAVGLFILAPMTMALFIGFAHFPAFGFFSFFLCIAVGVGILIYFFTQDEKYREELDLKKAKRDRKTEAISSTLWIGTVILFLFIGFFLNMWHPGWIVFLVAAAIQVWIDYRAKA